LQRRADLTWIFVGFIAVLVAVWAFPRAFPLYPEEWSISKEEAETIGLERLRDLGELPESPYIVTRVDTRPILEARLQKLIQDVDAKTVRESSLGKNLIAWEVVLYSRSGRSVDWTRRARISPSGEVSDLRMRIAPEEAREAIDEADARSRADQFLTEQGFDLRMFDEPEVRSRQLQARTDVSLRYPEATNDLGTDLDHGVEVSFAGNQLTGFGRYFEDPESVAFQSTLQPITLIQQAWVFLPILLVPLVAIPFVRRYHAGEIGVKRGLRIFAIFVACGVITMLFCARVIGAGFSIGVLTRPQVSWVVTFQFIVLFFVPMGLLAFLSWSVGESLCREKASYRLAAFDALFHGDWLNVTFARAVLRGISSGLVLVGAMALLATLLRSYGVWASTSFSFGDWWSGSSWLSIPLLAVNTAFTVYAGLFGRLFLASTLETSVGRWLGGIATAIIGALIFFPLLIVFPVSWSPLIWIVMPALLVFLFFRYGILTSIMAHLTASVTASSGPLLAADDAGIQLQAVIALLVVAAPLLVSVRYLWSNRKFVYRYEDVPPHVRRIAERERQKVELETARRIQSSILPELPPQLNGVEMSHSYIPATEVGGDFYDVLALEDGRLAVAVGDVAGHGVSSGLVMSMAKSALAVQVSFNPEVAAVFKTLNRLVYQSARKRLLTTLCYAVLDPKEREMFFASAGHLFPYRITGSGEVFALESVSYPLGVRDEIDVRVRTAKLEAGDYLFMFSDGVVEARRENTDELFGFERLERSLRRHAGGSVHDLRRGVLEDLDRFAGIGPREDDLTVLALQIA
jgi:hypothetical protein